MSSNTHTTRSAAPALGLLFAGGVCLAVSVPTFLLLGPALFLFFVLSLGCFPGEKIIEKAGTWRGRTLASAASSAEPVPETLDFVPPAGRHIAYALAVRPPPHLRVRQI